ncbi:MAG: DUF4397 domain-containing protein [Gemmatimonadaceae bacterium]
MNRFRSLAVLLCAAMLSSCEKNGVQELMTTAPAARIKFFNFGVNAPGVNFYANDAKMTAIGSATGTEAVIGTAYGSAASGGFYSGIAPGQYTLSGRIAAATDKDLAISNVATTLADGKFYSYYLSGFYNTTAKSVDAFIVEDPFVPEIDYAVAYVRFVNAISNANPMTLYVKNRATGVEVAVGAAVSYKGAGAFTAVPSGVYDLSTRYTGVATSAISRTEVSFSAGRVYTVGARGDITVTSATAANRPQLENTFNR